MLCIFSCGIINIAYNVNIFVRKMCIYRKLTESDLPGQNEPAAIGKVPIQKTPLRIFLNKILIRLQSYDKTFA